MLLYIIQRYTLYKDTCVIKVVPNEFNDFTIKTTLPYQLFS